MVRSLKRPATPPCYDKPRSNRRPCRVRWAEPAPLPPVRALLTGNAAGTPQRSVPLPPNLADAESGDFPPDGRCSDSPPMANAVSSEPPTMAHAESSESPAMQVVPWPRKLRVQEACPAGPIAASQCASVGATGPLRTPLPREPAPGTSPEPAIPGQPTGQPAKPGPCPNQSRSIECMA
jgi:hypothetical protein